MNIFIEFGIAFIGAFVLSIILTRIMRGVSFRFGVLDIPTGERKIHTKPIPLLGGLAIIITFLIMSSGLSFFGEIIGTGYVLPKYLIGITLASLSIALIGIFEDIHTLSPAKRLWLALIPVACIILSGIGISSLTNPFGGFIDLSFLEFTLFEWQGIPYKISLISDLFTVLWLMGMMFTTKLLDGLDGLVGGIGVIASCIIFFVSLRPDLLQYDTALLALMLGGACLGFLVYNFNPASVFLGESGSMFIGFMLGVLSIIAGSKIATALLIMGIPILDVVWVLFRRMRTGKKITEADRRHLHHRFLDAGFSQKQTVLIFYGVTIIFGLAAVTLQTTYKLWALSFLVLTMIGMGAWLVIRYKRYAEKNSTHS